MLLILCSVLFAACNVPFEDVTTPDIEPKTYTVYVCGAVENEGYFTVDEGTDILSLLLLAKPLAQAVYPQDMLQQVAANTKFVVVNYEIDDATYYCVNVNGGFVTAESQIENVSAEVVGKIAAYIRTNGKITDKTQLKEILGEQDYLENYYKFFVSVDDYEKAD